MKRILIVLLATVILSGCMPVASPIPPTPQDDKLAEVLARGTLIIATDADYAPQSKLLAGSLPDPATQCAPTQYTASQMTGFDVDVAIAVARGLGVEPCFVTPPWGQLVSGNWGDNWDVHVGSVAITADRMNQLWFSQPYYATPTVVLVHQDNETFQKPEDLSGKRIGICVGCTFEDYLAGTLQLPGEQIEYRIQNAQAVRYENEEPAIADLVEGDGVKLDAVITILPLADRAVAAGLPVKMLNEPLLFAYASITLDRFCHRSPTRMLAEITRIINELHQSDTLKQLSLAYMDRDLTQAAAQFDLASLQQKP